LLLNTKMQAQEDFRGEKWSCEYCTYLNWPTAGKCVMCHAPASRLQGQDIFSLDSKKDRERTDNIFNLETSAEPANPPTNFHQKNPDPESLKWSCTSCTYFNYARAIRCTQCLTPRKKVSPAMSRLSPGSPRGSPTPASSLLTSSTCTSTTISTVNRENAIRSLTEQFQPLRICDAVPLEAESSENLVQNVSSNVHNVTSKAKWSCLACTYENWQKSKSCVLCGVWKGRKSPEPQSLNPTSSPLIGHHGSHVSSSSPLIGHHGSNVTGSSTLIGHSAVSLSGHVTATSQAPSRDSPSPDGATVPRIDHGRRNSPRDRQTDRADRRAGHDRQRPQTDRRSSPESAISDAINSQEQSGSSSSVAVGGAMAGSNCNIQYEKRLRQLRRRMRETDWAWVSACMGVVEGDVCPIEAFINSGGDPTRKLSKSEATILDRPGVFEPGITLVHLAIKFQREDLLATLLSQIEGLSSRPVKRVPSYVAPDLAAAIRRQISLSLRHRKGGFPCMYVSDCATYTLPPEINDLPNLVQEELYKELLDNDAKAELESEMCINWCQEITSVLSSRLFPLWNRSAGDCLLDAALQATWGVFDRDNILRRALADSLTEAGHVFYPRWKEWETRQAQELSFSLADSQWQADWTDLLAAAAQPGASLEQLHIFCLAHVLRRPIIVYGVKYVKSWRGENLGYAKFEGVYLPLLWEPAFCYRSPVALGYTRGHFCALLPPEPDTGRLLGAARAPSPQSASCNYLPLVNSDREILPLHFTSRTEVGEEESLLRQWLDVGFTESGIMVAQQPVTRPPLLVAQMTEEWLNYYRKIAQSTSVPVVGGMGIHPPRIQLESSDDSTDDDC